MKTLSFLALVLLLTVSLFPLESKETNITGDWEMTIVLRWVDITFSYHFEQKGEKLLVFFRMNGKEPVAEGTVRGDHMEWTEKGETDAIFRGEINGDTIVGECRLGRSETLKWKAERKKEK